MIRTIIIDDEDLARERIINLLKNEKDISVIEECSDGEEALKKIDELKPDLIFLDVQMPFVNGVEVLMNLNEVKPEVIFVTAYDEYAVQAFELNAIDYLLKPFDIERFRKTIQRARERISDRSKDNLYLRLDQIIKSFSMDNKKGKYLNKFIIRSSGRISFVNVDEINYIESEGNYLNLHTSQGKHLIRDTISGITEKLDPDLFLRIHRSFIIRIDRIKEMQNHFNGEFIFIMTDNSKLKSGRSYKTSVEKLLKH